MGHILAIANQKGGVGKTTTAAVLAVQLSRRGIPVHLIDMDPQASLTMAFGMRDDDGLLYSALDEQTALPIIPLVEHLTFSPSSVDLAQAEAQFMAEPGREFLLKSCLEKSDLPDEKLVIIDCPPSLGVLALNCLTAASKLLVVVQPGGFELWALARLRDTVALLKKRRLNQNLEIIGAVLTNCNVRRIITEQVRAEVSKEFDVLGLVRTDSRLLYATTEGQLLSPHNSAAFADYAEVAGRLQKVLDLHPSEVLP